MGEVTRDIEQRIRQAVHLGAKTSKGFENCLCPHCKDTQFGRSGFRFEDDAIIYNCFRAKCDATCVFKEGDYVSKKFRRLMEEIGVELPTEALFQNKKAASHAQERLNHDLYQPIKVTEMTAPDFLVPLEDSTSTLWNHVTNDRKVCDTRNFFVVSTGSARQVVVFIKCWYGQKLMGAIYYQPDFENAKYRKHSHSSEGLMYLPYGYIPKEPILVEGVFDAHSVPDGVALLTNSISPEQAYLLRHTNPIFLPDRKGSYFFDDAKKYGWRIAVPEWDFKDPNEALQHIGGMEIAKRLHTSIFDDAKSAEVAFRFYHDI